MEAPDLECLLQEALGRDACFREGQREAIEGVAKRGSRTLLVQSTGWGKSLVYFLAARILSREGRGRTLVISPLIALMRNQVTCARRFGLRAQALHAENREDWAGIVAEVQTGGLDLLLISPERLHDEGFSKSILERFLPETALLVIDEAHCISEWGHDFRPEYRTILRQLKALLRDASILGATATATDRVVQDLRTVFGPFLEVRRGNLVRKSLRLVCVELPTKAERLAWLSHYLPRFPGSGIVYALTVFDAMEVSRWLQSHGITTEAYHAELGGERRVELENAFSENRVKALVATTALGMGYDKADVGFVVHYQMPASLIAYYQQIGRAGRATDRAYATLLAGEEDEKILESFVQSARPADRVFDKVVRELSRRPMGWGELLQEVRVAPSSLRQVLDILDSADALVEHEGHYSIRLPQARREIQHGETIRELRRKETQEITAYVKSRTCRMQAVAAALGDSAGEPCGICDVCRPIPAPKLDAGVVAEAAAFLEGAPKVLRPRTVLPIEIPGRGKALKGPERNRPGIVLGVYGDSNWGRMVREGKYGERRYSEALLEAARQAIRSLDDPPDWVAWIPSSRPNSPLEPFARKLAGHIGVEALPAVRRSRPAPPQKSMTTSEEQFLNVWGSFEVRDVRPGVCLLVDDIVDSGWTLTVAGLRLLEAGCEAVIPLALAAASTSRIKIAEEAP